MVCQPFISIGISWHRAISLPTVLIALNFSTRQRGMIDQILRRANPGSAKLVPFLKAPFDHSPPVQRDRFRLESYLELIETKA
jgi:hypothetical protein